MLLLFIIAFVMQTGSISAMEKNDPVLLSNYIARDHYTVEKYPLEDQETRSYHEENGQSLKVTFPVLYKQETGFDNRQIDTIDDAADFADLGWTPNNSFLKIKYEQIVRVCITSHHITHARLSFWFAKLPYLQAIDLSFNRITHLTKKDLKNIPNGALVNLAGNHIWSVERYPHLYTKHNVTLILRSNHLLPAEANALAQSAQQPNLSWYDLYNHCINWCNGIKPPTIDVSMQRGIVDSCSQECKKHLTTN